MRKKLLFCVLTVLVCLSMFGCKKSNEASQATPVPTPTPPGSVAPVANAVQVTVDNSKTQQKIDGFGASMAFYDSLLYWSKDKQAVYDLLYKDAKLSVVRLKGEYGYRGFNPKFNLDEMKEINKRASAYGEKPLVLMSSWSPEGDLKESGNTIAGGLKKNADGTYPYDKVGEYYAKEIQEYQKLGINVDYLSIQNECDFEPTYDGCLYSFMDNSINANYAKAFLATYNALKNVPNAPKLLGPETMTAEPKQIQAYMNEVFATAPESVAGICHHLYNGGSYTEPNSFINSFQGLNKMYPNLTKWQTEFYRGNFLQTAQIIQNSMIYENLNAYLYWAAVWYTGENSQSLIGLDAVDNEGYQVNEQYYALRHFSEFIRPGYTRIDTNVADNKDITVSAYVNDKQDKMVAVAINGGTEDKTIQLQFANYTLKNSSAIVSKVNGTYKAEDMYKATNGLGQDQTVVLPAGSVMTINLEGTTNVVTQSAIGTSSSVQLESGKLLDSVQGTPSLKDYKDPAWNNAKIDQIDKIANGDSGASAEFKTLYDEKNLYIQVKVNDKTKGIGVKDVGLNDSVEVFLNENNSKPGKYAAGDSHYKVSRENNVEYTTGCDKSNFKSNTYEINDGYIVEFVVPLQTVKGVAGTQMGFDLQVNDNFGGDKVQWVIKWNDTSMFTKDNLVSIGTLALK